MAVPKKKTSKSKKNIRKYNWKQKVSKQVTRAFFLAKYLLKTTPEENLEKSVSSGTDTIKEEEK